MEEDHERFKQEAGQATMIYYQLRCLDYPVVQELPLEEAERADFTAKFSVVVSGYAALVWRDWDGAYKVTDNPELDVDDPEIQRLVDEQAAAGQEAYQEAYNVLTTALQYLEIDLMKVSRIHISTIKGGASLSRSWLVTLNEESCVVDHYDEDDGPRYAIRIPPTEKY